MEELLQSWVQLDWPEDLALPESGVVKRTSVSEGSSFSAGGTGAAWRDAHERAKVRRANFSFIVSDDGA
jgi:hypothetical protein